MSIFLIDNKNYHLAAVADTCDHIWFLIELILMASLFHRNILSDSNEKMLEAAFLRQHRHSMLDHKLLSAKPKQYLREKSKSYTMEAFFFLKIILKMFETLSRLLFGSHLVQRAA